MACDIRVQLAKNPIYVGTKTKKMLLAPNFVWGQCTTSWGELFKIFYCKPVIENIISGEKYYNSISNKLLETLKSYYKCLFI